ncbi:MAG: polysaccharide biosynthesis C-terminal domain-containing protein [Marinilabiliales bacterium]|nr:polysaccharide biosynthesis C-terminal domain-containing protein [Marinilabiliales bacterium]
MSALKKLAGDTMIYGMSSIVGRFLNYLLTPIYAWTFVPDKFGIMSNLLAYVSILQVFLTYGMETSYFRYASRHSKPNLVFGTALGSIALTSSAFVLLVLLFSKRLAGWVELSDHPEYVVWMGLTVALDALSAIPFGRLRLQERPIKFAFFKLVNIGVNILLNLFWILLCPRVLAAHPQSFLRYFYSPEIGIGYVFLSYLIASVVTMVLFIPDLSYRNLKFDGSLLKEMLHYGWPILIVGITGMVILNIDKILIPELITGGKDPKYELGVYAASGKLAILMTLFIQAFRFSFEPFLFSHYKNEASKKVYSVIMNYFVIFGLLIFLGVECYIDVLKFFIGSTHSGYHEGLSVVPWLLMGNLFLGIFYTQSLWYKLTDQTRYGALFSIIGSVITLVINVIFIPHLGYLASAYGFFVSTLVMTLVSYYYGQKYFPVPYELKKLGLYFLVAIALYVIILLVKMDRLLYTLGFRTLLFSVFLFFIWRNERSDLIRLVPKRIADRLKG